MSPLLFLCVGFAPGVFWLWYIFRKNRARPDPKYLVVRTFLLGVAVAIPIAIAEQVIGGPAKEAFGAAVPTVAAAAYGAFIVAGMTEELGKFLLVRYSLLASPYLDEPMSGLVFGSAAALGFASIENVGYMINFGAEVIAVRAPVSTLAHVVFSSFWGYALGWQKQRMLAGAKASGVTVFFGVATAAALHGLFDFFLMKKDGDAYLSYVLFAVGVFVFFLLLRRAAAVSPFKASIAPSIHACARCGVEQAGFIAFCSSCGNDLQRNRGAVRCGRCEVALRAQARFCPACGCRVAERAA